MYTASHSGCEVYTYYSCMSNIPIYTKTYKMHIVTQMLHLNMMYYMEYLYLPVDIWSHIGIYVIWWYSVVYRIILLHRVLCCHILSHTGVGWVVHTALLYVTFTHRYTHYLLLYSLCAVVHIISSLYPLCTTYISLCNNILL